MVGNIVARTLRDIWLVDYWPSGLFEPLGPGRQCACVQVHINHIQYIDAIQLLRMYDILLIIEALITLNLKQLR